MPGFRSAQTPYLSDWLAISLRWLVLMGMTVMIAAAQEFSALGLAALLVAVLWNLSASLLALLNRRIPAHRRINLAVDLMTALLIFFGTGGLSGPASWSGLLPMLTAGIYYELKGSLAAAGVMSLAQAAWMVFALLEATSFTAPFILPAGVLLKYAGALTAGHLLAGGLVGLACKSVVKAMQRTYQAQLDSLNASEVRARQAERERVQSFYKLLEVLSASLDYQAVLKSAMELSATALGDRPLPEGQIVSAVLLMDKNELRVGAARRFSADDQRLTFPAAQGVLQEIMLTAQPRLLMNPASDPELGMLEAMRPCRSALALPMQRGLASYGIMMMAHPDPDFFTPERCELLELISHQAVIAIQNARLYQRLQMDKERILETQDEARKKLARDLHDGPTQSVSAIAMGISIARRLLERDPKKADDELARVENLARRTTEEIRHMLFTLRPLVLETDGLAAALQAMADKMRDTFNQNVKVEADPAVEKRMDMSKQTMVFYLAEEAVNNARKHANAKQVVVRLGYLPRDRTLALLEIIDDGVGFIVSKVANDYERRGSLGMVNLRERTELINGLLNIDSTPGQGTTVSVMIPLNDEAVYRLQKGAAAEVREASPRGASR